MTRTFTEQLKWLISSEDTNDIKGDTQYKPQANTSQTFTDLNDPNLIAFLSGVVGGNNAKKALFNTTVLRCFSVICNGLSMLPVHLYEKGKNKQKAVEHPLYKLLKHKPNNYQTAMQFKQFCLMQTLKHGNAYARVIRSRGKVIQLIPLMAENMVVSLNNRFEPVYKYTTKDGKNPIFQAKDIFHFKELSEDGLNGLSRLEKAKNAIELANDSEEAIRNIFKKGVMVGGSLTTDSALTDEQFERLKSQAEAKAGKDHAGEWLILENGLKAQLHSSTAQDAQVIENRRMQIEEIGRAFNIERPFLLLDDTTWGTGVMHLRLQLLNFCLQPYATSFEQSLAFSLLEEDEYERYYFKFNFDAMLKGTSQERADYLTKALGAGGQMPFITANEARDFMDMPRFNDPIADKLQPYSMNKITEAKTTNEQ